MTTLEPKYKNAKAGYDVPLPAERHLYGLDQARGLEEVVLVEGVMDKIAIGRAAVSTLGKNISTSRIRMLQAAGVQHVIVFFDSDVPDHERRQVLTLLKRYMPVRWTASETRAKDAGEMTPSEIEYTLSRAREVTLLDELGLNK
jgi:5S rRNA maturation endonuclease (ribonuclease M5)